MSECLFRGVRRQHKEKWFSTLDSSREAQFLKSQIYLVAGVFQLQFPC